MKPLGRINHWLDYWLAERSLTTERLQIEAPARVVWLILRQLVLWLAATVGVFWVFKAPGGWLGVLVGVFLALYIGVHGICGLKRVNAYRNGWLDGRHQMMVALIEASNRGMSVEDWFEGEMARDFALMGVDPETWRPKDG